MSAVRAVLQCFQDTLNQQNMQTIHATREEHLLFNNNIHAKECPALILHQATLDYYNLLEMVVLGFLADPKKVQNQAYLATQVPSA